MSSSDNQPIVSVTEAAAGEIRSKLEAEPQGNNKGLRVYVEEGGCSGMKYGMVFDEERPGDFKAAFFGVSVLVDPVSANYVRGSVIDFSDALTGGGFKIINPNAAQSCGCGRSFQSV